jgi:hypothetical protein
MRTSLIPFMILAWAAPAAAAPPPPDVSSATDPSTIVVTGERVSEKGVRDFVRALTPVPSYGQISRFERSICPAVSGLPGQQAEAVESRIRRVAQTVGIRVGGAGCTPSVVVIVTGDKMTLLNSLRRYRPEYFGDLSSSQIRQIFHQPGPAAAWQLQGPMLNSRGVEISNSSIGGPINRTTDPGSRITAAARPQFDSAVVVVERNALAGLTVTQLADYAAMRAFAKVDPSKLADTGARTILRVLDAPMGSPVPVTLTNWDLGFLKGLYSAPPNLATGAQRSAIQETVSKELEREPGERRDSKPRKN